MSEQIKYFRLKIRNTEKLGRQSMAFGLNEAKALDSEITRLEERIVLLENTPVQQTESIVIVGEDF